MSKFKTWQIIFKFSLSIATGKFNDDFFFYNIFLKLLPLISISFLNFWYMNAMGTNFVLPFISYLPLFLQLCLMNMFKVYFLRTETSLILKHFLNHDEYQSLIITQLGNSFYTVLLLVWIKVIKSIWYEKYFHLVNIVKKVSN